MVLVLWATLAIAISFLSWDFLRGPLERTVAEKTGRELKIGGQLRLKWAWPLPHIIFEQVSFANPPWAEEPLMFRMDEAEVTLDLSELLKRVLVLIEVRLVAPEVHIEQSAGGQKNWLLDTEQKDEDSRVQIGRLLVDRGRISYVDPRSKTRLEAQLATHGDAGVELEAKGTFKGQALAARASGGPVLSIREESNPYPLKIEGTVGKTRVRAEGTITALAELAAVDLQIALQGENLGDLYTLLGIAFPQTRAYTTTGHLVHKEKSWGYENFTGRIGGSDIAGSIHFDAAGERPSVRAELTSKLLDVADLGTLVGADTPRKRERVLPDAPFSTERWGSVDADITLRAQTLRRAKELPLSNLLVRAKLDDSQLNLAPLEFGFAGGQVSGVVTLDGQRKPVQVHARLHARRVALGQLMPKLEGKAAGVGRASGTADLRGSGDSVADVLGTADGKVGLVVEGGEMSNLAMEIIGIDLWEMLRIKAQGDKPVHLRCAVADFGVKGGVMTANALVLDTADTNVLGSGTIRLGDEQLDLTLNPQPKDKSPLAIRSPIRVQGTFSEPKVGPDKGTLAAKGGGAAVLALINPLLAVIPLIETGPGVDSDCGRLIANAKKIPATKEPVRR